jgi:hypothetical protein
MILFMMVFAGQRQTTRSIAMKTSLAKLTAFTTMALLMIPAGSGWCGDISVTQRGGGPGGGGMMGGGYGISMGQLRAADLDGDAVPEIVTIAGGSYLLILDNEGKQKSSTLLPAIPGQTYSFRVRAAGLDVADMDGDDSPEIITEYHGYYGSYLVILDNQGNLKSYQQLPYVLY